MVPAETTRPSSSFSLARSFACASELNVRVARERRILVRVLGTSKVTNHVCCLSIIVRFACAAVGLIADIVAPVFSLTQTYGSFGGCGRLGDGSPSFAARSTASFR